MNKRTISRLNDQFLAHHGPTDVLTFDYRDDLDVDDDEAPVLGEIIVCPDVAAEAAGREGTTPTYEVVLYMVHGMLHLAGYDDHSPADRERMREAEQQVMGELLKDGPLEGIFA